MKKNFCISFFTLLLSAVALSQQVTPSPTPSVPSPTPTPTAAGPSPTEDPGTETEPGKIYIKVGEAQVKKSLLALPQFQHLGTGAGQRNVGTELHNTVLNDLDISTYFQMMESQAFIEDTTKVGLRPIPNEPGGFNYDNWQKIGAEFLIRAGYSVLQNQLTLEGYVYHIPQKKLIFGRKYEGPVAELRRIAHSFSNHILQELTGKTGMFLSRVVVSSDRGGNKWKEIYVMDWDGQNIRKITDVKSIAISPAWAPDGKAVAYTAFAFHPAAKVRNADLFSFDLISGKRFLLSSRTGINSGACYFPDGKHLLLTISQGGNPDIYKMTTDGEALEKITNGPTGAMNVEPAVSPDGKRIAFSSDRSGSPMIYVMNVDGSGVKRMTFAGRYNASPAWSPDGKRLAFAGYDKDHFDIFIMDADGANLERLTSAPRKSGKLSSNEDPTFSPDGRHVMFVSDRTGKKQLYIVNLDGTNERRLTTDSFNYFKPKWSKNIE